MARFWLTFRERRAVDPRADALQRVTDYRVTFGNEAGQRVLADIARRAGVMQTTWGEDGADASAFREGRRRLALEIIETINADPGAMEKAALTGNTEEIFNHE